MRSASIRETSGTSHDLGPAGSGTRARPELEVLGATEVRLDVFCPRLARGTVAAAAYDLWHAVWLSTLRHLDGVSHLDSNEFARQDEILALSHGERCISVTALRFVDRSMRMGREDSYFGPWPPEALEQLEPSVAISSNTVVAEGYRRALVGSSGSDEPLRLSELIIAVALRRFAASKVPQFVGVARNDRKMDRVGNRLGGRAVGQIVLHGIPSDIMIFPRHGLPPLGPTVEDIWSRRSGCRDEGDS